MDVCYHHYLIPDWAANSKVIWESHLPIEKTIFMPCNVGYATFSTQKVLHL